MRQLIIYPFCAFLISITAFTASAADKTKALLAIESARTAVNQLIQQSSGSSLVEQDLTASRSYLQKAEDVFKKNTSWIPLKGLSEEAEPEILDLAEMAEQSAKTGLSKINTQTIEQEYQQLDKKVADAREKIRILENQATEMQKLKANAGELAAMKLDQATFDKLKAENSALKQELEKQKTEIRLMAVQLESTKAEKQKLTEQIESLKLEKAKLSGQIETIHTERKVDEMRSVKKLSDAERSATFKEKLSSLGAVTDITENSLVLVFPRRNLIKTTSKGHQIAPDADKQTRELMALIPQYPEYQLSMQVFGYGKPPKQENQKAADQMAILIRDFFALKLGIKADKILSTGSVGASTLFSTATAEPHRRVEIKFSKKP